MERIAKKRKLRNSCEFFVEMEGAPAAVGHVLDLRNSREDYLALHIVGSAHMPLSELQERFFELPAPPDTLTVVLEDDTAEDSVAATLRDKGYEVTRVVRAAQLTHRKDCESGKAFNCLWKANPSLLDCWPHIVAELQTWDPQMKRVCIDLAAGNGRDSIHLARYARFHCIAIDYLERQYSKIDAITARALREMPDAEVASFGSVVSDSMDLEKDDPARTIDVILANLLRGEPAHMIVVSRYLHRPLFPHLHRLLAPGGLLLYHTFMDGCQNIGRKTPTKPRFLLQNGELATVFKPHFDVIVDNIIHLSDGRPTSNFLARKRKEENEK